MTVKMLIEELQNCDPEGRVMLHHPKGEEVIFCCWGNPAVVWLECASDVDLKGELKAELDNANEIASDESDFYAFWLERGITIEMVRSALGEEAASHMEMVCKDHGSI